HIEIKKGPYAAEEGDLATAGAINLITKGASESSASIGGGSFNTVRSLVMLGDASSGWKPFLAAEVYRSDGPFESPENLQRINAFRKVSRTLGAGAQLSLSFASYAGSWHASGQVPERAVASGALARFG